MPWWAAAWLAPPPPPSHRRAWGAALFLAAFVVRSLYAVDLSPSMYSHQQEGTRMAARYDEAALAILGGDGILFPAHPDPADTGRLARPPGYALFMAGVYAAAGRSFFVVQLAQNLLGSLAPLLVLVLGERLLGWRVGLVGGWLSALSAHVAYTTNLILADALCPLPLLLALVLLAPRDGRPPGVLAVLGAGACLGAAAWLRPNVLLLGPWVAVAVVLAGRGRRRLWDAALLCAASLLVIAPITLRNWIVYREFVPVSINGGITLLQGVADAGGRRFGVRPRDKLVIEEEAAYYGDERLAEWWAAPDGIRRDRERYREAMREIRARPLWYARAMGRRMGAMLGDFQGEPEPVSPRLPAADARAAAEATDPAWPPVLSAHQALGPGRMAWPLRPLVWAAQQALRWLALPLLVLGTVLLLRHDARRAALLLAVPAYYLFFESFFIYEWRVAVPMRYPAFVLMAAGAVALAGLRRRRQPPATP